MGHAPKMSQSQHWNLTENCYSRNTSNGHYTVEITMRYLPRVFVYIYAIMFTIFFPLLFVASSKWGRGRGRVLTHPIHLLPPKGVSEYIESDQPIKNLALNNFCQTDSLIMLAPHLSGPSGIKLRWEPKTDF